MTSAQPAGHHRRSRARRGQGDRLRDEIVAATADLLEQAGDQDAVSIRAIADAVGVSPPSIYLHFPDKTALLFAVCAARFRELDQVMEAAAAPAIDPLDEIRRRGAAYIRFGLEHPEQYRILFMGREEPMGFSEEHLADASAFDHMVEAVTRAMRAGLVADGDPAVVTIGLWAAVHGLTSLLIAKPDFPWPPVEELTEQVLRMCSQGVQTAVPAPTPVMSP
jgi:AcrR family transcriptional regulator